MPNRLLALVPDLIIKIVEKLPVERIFIHPREPLSDLDILAKITEDRKMSPVSPKPIEISVPPAPAAEKSKVTTAETIEYQKRELKKELTALEIHLQQGGKIMDKPCDCIEKHALTVEKLSQETFGITGDNTFREMSEWAKKLGELATAKNIEDGKVDFGAALLTSRGFRKLL